MKTIIAGIGFVLTMVGASCDIDKSDMRVVTAIVLIGCFFMWIGGKDYEYEEEAQEEKEDYQDFCTDCFSDPDDELDNSFAEIGVFQKYRKRS